MLGQAYAKSEGTSVDLGLADKHFHAACELDPEGESCDYAEVLQEELEKNDNRE